MSPSAGVATLRLASLLAGVVIVLSYTIMAFNLDRQDLRTGDRYLNAYSYPGNLPEPSWWHCADCPARSAIRCRVPDANVYPPMVHSLEAAGIRN